jgi:hypothetical protein
VVLASGSVRALGKAAPSLVDAIRETKNLFDAMREQRRLNP